MSSSPFKSWIQFPTQSVQPLPCCNLSSVTSGEVLQPGFFPFFAFEHVGVVAKKSPTSENHYLLQNEGSLFVTEIAPLLACFFASSCHHLSCPHLSYFLNPTDRKSISKRDEHISSHISVESRITWTHQGVRPIPASSQGKWGDDFFTKQQVTRWPNLEPYFNSPNLVSPPGSIHYFMGTFWGL